MKNIKKVILLICMIAWAGNASAQWTFTMSLSYSGRDCGIANSLVSTINQRMQEGMAGMQWPTNEQCMAARNDVQSFFNRLIASYNYPGLDCKPALALGGCTGQDIGGNTLQLGVSKGAVFQSSNPANEVEDWHEMQSSIVDIFGNLKSDSLNSMAQTEHIHDFIGGLDQIDHVVTSPSSGKVYPIIPDNAWIDPYRNLPSMPKADDDMEPLPAPNIDFDDGHGYVPDLVDLPWSTSEWFDLGRDALKTAWDLYQIAESLGFIAAGTLAELPVWGTIALGVGVDFTINLVIEDCKVFYLSWNSKPAPSSGLEIIAEAAKETFGSNLIETAFHEGLSFGAKAIDAGLKDTPISSMLSISTRAVKYIGKSFYNPRDVQEWD